MLKGSSAFRVEQTNFVTDVVLFGWGFFPLISIHTWFYDINQVLKTANASIDNITPINLLHSSLYLHCFISFLYITLVALRVTCTAAATNKYGEAP